MSLSILNSALSAIVIVVVVAAAPAPATAAEDNKVRQCMRECVQKQGPDHRAECRKRCAPDGDKKVDCRQAQQACKERCEGGAVEQCAKACLPTDRQCKADCRKAAPKCMRDCRAEHPECARGPGGDGKKN